MSTFAEIFLSFSWTLFDCPHLQFVDVHHFQEFLHSSPCYHVLFLRRGKFSSKRQRDSGDKLGKTKRLSWKERVLWGPRRESDALFMECPSREAPSIFRHSTPNRALSLRLFGQMHL
ncbi:unnamed protein product, partial [Mesorhabditis belari]|uniref:Uncharacterized protein n=1 Tax=Mesorhabditis belari TaxID=2138241 RepID=A0AAF3EHA9_9BILA